MFKSNRRVFCNPWKVPLITVLNHTAWSPSWWVSDWSHGHFKPRYYHVNHCCQSCVMVSIFDSCGGIANLFPDFIGNTFSTTWSWLALSSPTEELSKFLKRPLVWGFMVSVPIASALVTLPILKSFEVSFNWLRTLLFWCFFLRLETILRK